MLLFSPGLALQNINCKLNITINADYFQYNVKEILCKNIFFFKRANNSGQHIMSSVIWLTYSGFGQSHSNCDKPTGECFEQQSTAGSKKILAGTFGTGLVYNLKLINKKNSTVSDLKY